MEAQNGMEGLQARLAEALRRLPGATALYLFGSRATGRADAYADLDLQVFSTDLEAARDLWPQFLETVGPMEVAWPVGPPPQNSAYTVLFYEKSTTPKGWRTHYKVDIGLDVAGKDAKLPTPRLLLWSRRGAQSHPSPVPLAGTLRAAPAMYLPAFGTTGHLVVGELIAALRYVAARKRGQTLTCWRFMRAKPDCWLALMADQRQKRQLYGGQLTTWDYKALDTSLADEQRAQFMAHLDWSRPEAMDRSLCWFMAEIIELAQHRAAALGEELPADVLQRLLASVCGELGRSPDRRGQDQSCPGCSSVCLRNPPLRARHIPASRRWDLAWPAKQCRESPFFVPWPLDKPGDSC